MSKKVKFQDGIIELEQEIERLQCCENQIIDDLRDENISLKLEIKGLNSTVLELQKNG
jgi:hypothetical protein